MKLNDSISERVEQKKKVGGGAAFGGGANFQAQLTAIVGAHILRGIPLGWLDGICDDQPVAVWAESEGPGDDLRIELLNGSAVEVQAKKGLVRGEKLWSPLMTLAKAICSGQLAYGVLVIASDSSATIKIDLADDIERIGQKRGDHLTDIGADFVARLHEEGITAEIVCSAIRIREIDTLMAKSRDITFAKSILREICEREADAASAFDILGYRALRLIENRGRWTLRDLVLLLKSRGIKIRNDGSPAALLDRHADWVCSTHNDFVITGAVQRIPIEHLLPMQLQHRAFAPSEAVDASSAFERYRNIPSRVRGGNIFDSTWTGRFRKLAVVVAGPGLGKSTMLRELAHQYAKDGYTVLSAPLPWIAAGIHDGRTFADRLFTRSFDGSGVAASEIRNFKYFNWVVLLDALDECGQRHDLIAEEIRRFSLGYPNARIIVTTRPIGYTSNALMAWQHYSLLPPRDGAGSLTKLLGVIAPDDFCTPALPKGFGSRDAATDGFTISPQLLGMSAVLITQGRALPDSRAKLYMELLKLFEGKSESSGGADGAVPHDIAIIVLDMTGWLLFQNPLQSLDILLNDLAEVLAAEIMTTVTLCKGHARTALEHWERLGLIETVHHDGERYVAFIHKTFCEFVASRHLGKQAESTIEKVIDGGGQQELLNFAVASELANKLIDIYLRRHADGLAGQLPAALEFLSIAESKVSNDRVVTLIREAFKSIDNCTADIFVIAGKLCNVDEKISLAVKVEAACRLQSSNSAIKLVALALIAELEHEASDIDLAAELRDLVSGAKPYDPEKTPANTSQNGRDLDLLRRIALSALRVQPGSLARSFAERELRDSSFSCVGFIIDINEHLESRGIKPLETLLDSYLGAKIISAGNEINFDHGMTAVILAFAKAFAPSDGSALTTPVLERPLPQLSAFIWGSGYMSSPSSEARAWANPCEGLAAASTLRYLASVLPLDLEALQQECSEVLELHAAGKTSFRDVRPYVDIPELTLPSTSKPPAEILSIKRAILHPSAWLSGLATSICEPFAMSAHELQQLLHESQGHALRNILHLIQVNHEKALMELAWNRLDRDSAGDVSGIFALFLNAGSDWFPELVNTTLACLIADNKSTAAAAAKLLQQWQEQGLALNKARLEQAVEHWGGREAARRLIFRQAPLCHIIELADNASI
ncbi:NACHT domain-containing protein [Pseudomonas fortuita]|uniref:NACHT domain-containing protein n=1 Tax=Pseudomonas fortuita TaxID=3233375 RepID=UPI003DA0B6F6